VLVDITKDAQQASIDWAWDPAPVRMPGYRPKLEVTTAELEKALALIRAAERPVGKTLAGEAKAWRYGVGLQPVYSVEWPEPGKDPKNPSLEIFRYQVEGR
jgi:hypothetical protein